MTSALPLAGVTVLDLTRALAGPYCTALLSDLGATITKVESVSGGDITRGWPPFEGEHSLYFESVNRGKSSIAVDFYAPDGQALLRELALRSDVVVENFRAGVMAELGLDPDSLRAEKPSLIVASVSGFGSTGPLAGAAGLDQVAQGMSGLMSVTGPDAEHPYRFGVPVIDTVAGIVCALGIVSTLLRQERTGVGGTVSTSLLESALALAVFQGQTYLSTGRVPRPNGNDHGSITPYGVFATGDIPLVIAVGNDRQWLEFCRIIGSDALGADARYATGRSRTEHRHGLKDAIEARLVLQGSAVWLEALRGAGIPCGPIYSYDQVFADEQVLALGMVQEVTRVDGSTLPLLRGPLSIDGVPTSVVTGPPALGEHTLDVLRSHGLDDAAIADLTFRGIVRAATS